MHTRGVRPCGESLRAEATREDRGILHTTDPAGEACPFPYIMALLPHLAASAREEEQRSDRSFSSRLGQVCSWSGPSPDFLPLGVSVLSCTMGTDIGLSPGTVK